MLNGIDYGQDAYVGLNTQYPNVDGQMIERVYLDSTATTLAMKESMYAAQRYCAHYSNTHSEIHNAAKISSDVVAWCHQQILSYFGVEENSYTALMSGSGATSAINLFSRRLAKSGVTGRVLLSSMEHHANDLPHRENFDNVVFIPCVKYDDGDGEIDIEFLASYLANNSDVAFIAVTAVSNVTGIINSIVDIAKIANQYGIPLLVDMAQGAAHVPLTLSTPEYWIDAIAFSSHKIYAPGGPGVLVARNALLETTLPTDFGGGAVSSVSKSEFVYEEALFHKENPGTLNITGMVSLAVALKRLLELGVSSIYDEELALTKYLLDGLNRIDSIRVYGSLQVKRIAAVSFNVGDLPHGLVAVILNDYFNIAVRNQCFCAHPYVKSLLNVDFLKLDISGFSEKTLDQYIDVRRGMVRASIGVYTKKLHIDKLLSALRNIVTNESDYVAHYQYSDGKFVHDSYSYEVSVEQVLGYSSE